MHSFRVLAHQNPELMLARLLCTRIQLTPATSYLLRDCLVIYGILVNQDRGGETNPV